MKRSSRSATCVLALGAALFSDAGPARATTLPGSARLDPVRPALEQTVGRAASDGLPSDLIVSKVREGLAKGIAPEAIRATAERLASDLAEAARFLRAHRHGSFSPALVRALAEARAAAIDLESLAPLCESEVPNAALIRAVEVLTDLALRGAPGARAASVVKAAVERSPSDAPADSERPIRDRDRPAPRAP
jgi:hypothetical protein